MPTPPAVHRLGGVACIVLALICFGALDTTSKVAAALAPVGLALWVRYLVQTLATAAILWPRQRLQLLHSRRPLLQGLRAVLLVSCNGIAFVSLAHMHVGEFSAIVMLTPLLLTVVAARVLREPVSWLRWACLLGGFGGTLLVLRPGRELFQPAMLLPLVLVLANTGFQLVTSALAKADAPGTIHFYSGLGGLALTSLGLPLAWQALPLGSWGVLLLMAAFGACGHFLLIMAYARTPVAILTPYLYLQIGFGALGGWIVFSHVPDGPALAGIGLICVCGVYGTWLTGREIIARSRQEAEQSSIAAIAGADEH
ncbi:DMT family transporter [Aquabacterium sp.]|uniref:DMT family transporter n=1 Tax=Aquabacterium sp. TaxID=1872578 RepID=UPI003784CA6A